MDHLELEFISEADYPGEGWSLVEVAIPDRIASNVLPGERLVARLATFEVVREGLLDLEVEPEEVPVAQPGTLPEPEKQWRLLGPDEVIQAGDWVNSKDNSPGARWPLATPPRGGWLPACGHRGRKVFEVCGLEYCREVKPETSSEPEYREPTIADVGKMVEVRDSPECEWADLELLAVIQDKNIYERFVCRKPDNFRKSLNWAYARIRKESPV